MPPSISHYCSSTRATWLSVLAHAQGNELASFENILKNAQYHFLRSPEIGMALVRAKMGGTGEQFNIGETTITRCVVALSCGIKGFGYVLGRDKKHAELAALADAHLQKNVLPDGLEQLISSLSRAQQKRHQLHQKQHAGSRVEFFTLVRGEE